MEARRVDVSPERGANEEALGYLALSPHMGDRVKRLRASASASGFPNTKRELWTDENFS